MLRYLEGAGLVVPGRTAAGYRRYGIRELNQLRALGALRTSFGVELDELAFAIRRAAASLRAVDTWPRGRTFRRHHCPAWVEWGSARTPALTGRP
jgi:DNA-binding transcriptional MerR regulator